jgi:hypothetical protein
MKIIKDLGTKQVGSRKQRFALVECPECKVIEERRVRSDCSPLCRACAMKQAGKKRAAKEDAQGDTSKSSPYYRLYQIWRGMKRRCTEPNAMGYNLYGAKGVTVCSEWLTSYTKFKEWSLANGYTDTMTIDKDELCEAKGISPKMYSPDTCIWKLREENSITNMKLTEEQAKACAKLLEERKATPEELAKQYGVKRKTILNRTVKYRKSKYKA